jgi:hypothetical protein
MRQRVIRYRNQNELVLCCHATVFEEAPRKLKDTFFIVPTHCFCSKARAHEMFSSPIP